MKSYLYRNDNGANIIWISGKYRAKIFYASGMELYDIDNFQKVEGISYQEFVNMLHPTKKVYYEKDSDWQGNWVSVLEDTEGTFYFQQGRFGSCSGCDRLKSIERKFNKEKIKSFLDDLTKVTKIGGSKQEAVEYLKNEERNLSFMGDSIKRLRQKFEEMVEDE